MFFQSVDNYQEPVHQAEDQQVDDETIYNNCSHSLGGAGAANQKTEVQLMVERFVTTILSQN